MDQVDKVITQWQQARPDLEMSTVGPLGRLSRVNKKVTAVEEETFARYGLNMAGFDVLSGLRRAGPPYALPAGELTGAMMITAGTMTNRIDQLEKQALVKRLADPKDARKAIVSLTPKGLAVIDKAIVEHIDTQKSLLSAMTANELEQLDGLLKKLSLSLGL